MSWGCARRSFDCYPYRSFVLSPSLRFFVPGSPTLDHRRSSVVHFTSRRPMPGDPGPPTTPASLRLPDSPIPLTNRTNEATSRARASRQGDKDWNIPHLAELPVPLGRTSVGPLYYSPGPDPATSITDRYASSERIRNPDPGKAVGSRYTSMHLESPPRVLFLRHSQLCGGPICEGIGSTGSRVFWKHLKAPAGTNFAKHGTFDWLR
jgi:hypothetical protein